MSSTTLTTSKYNWAEQLKVEVGDLSQTKTTATGERAPLKPIAAGRYPGFLQEVKHGSFKTGSYGMSFTYVLEGGEFNNRKIKETIVLTKANGEAVNFSGARLKRRLMSLGLPIEKINAFKGPRNEHDLGDFRLVIGAPVTVIVKEDGEYDGRPSRKVAAVYSRELTY